MIPQLHIHSHRTTTGVVSGEEAAMEKDREAEKKSENE